MSARRHPRGDRHACGCTHDGYRWLELCAQHSAESADLHERANQEHARDRDMRQIVSCAVCGALLPWPRVHTDTCSERCYRAQLDAHRAQGVPQ